MQIERLAKDLSYLGTQALKGGAFFQYWTSGELREPEFAPGVAHDAVYIYGKRKPLPENVMRVLKEIERRAPETDLLPIVFTLGWMVGKAHERWRVFDPQSKRLLKAVRRRGA